MTADVKIIVGGLVSSQEKKTARRLRKEEIYKRMYYESLYSENPDEIKIVLCGVKYQSMKQDGHNTPYRELLQSFLEMQEISRYMETLTYREMVQIFPIRKDFDGWRYEAKDYWSCKEYLSEKNLDAALGTDVDEFLWSYYNDNIMHFGIKKTLVFDRLIRQQGGRGLLEGFLDQIDPKHEIHTYHVHREEGYIYDTVTGKTEPLSKPKKRHPKYLKVL